MTNVVPASLPVLTIIIVTSWAQVSSENQQIDILACNESKLEIVGLKFQDCLLKRYTIDDVRLRVKVGRENDIMDVIAEEMCLDACMSEAEVDGSQLLMELTESVLNWACYKDGDKILTFFSNGGLECLDNKTQDLVSCVYEFMKDFGPADFDLKNFRSTIKDTAICRPYSQLQECVNGVMGSCPQIAPGSMVQSLLQNLEGFTSCKK